MVMKYVVAGTSPLSWWSKSVHILLKEAIIAKWTTDILDPPVAYVNFNETWFTDSADLEFTFEFIREEPKERSIGWNRYNYATFVAVHMWVKGSSVSEEPDYVHKCKTAFENLIELNNRTLLAPAIVTIDHADQIKDPDHRQHIYHYEFDITVWYDRVKVNVP